MFNYGLGVDQAAFFAPRPAGDPSFGQWFSDTDVPQIGDGELSRDGSLLVVGAGGGLDLNNLATPQDAPGKRADGVYVWSLKRGCTGTARRIARGGVDPDFGPAG